MIWLRTCCAFDATDCRRFTSVRLKNGRNPKDRRIEVQIRPDANEFPASRHYLTALRLDDLDGTSVR